jgi:hypothetical protein
MKTLEKLLALLNMIQADKRLHYLVGTLLALSVIFVSPLIAFMIVSGFAAGKELYDGLFSNIHTQDTWDAAWTIAGGMVVLIPAAIYNGGIL